MAFLLREMSPLFGNEKKNIICFCRQSIKNKGQLGACIMPPIMEQLASEDGEFNKSTSLILVCKND